MKRILISVTNDLSTDQRLAKVCSTLHNARYDILLIGRLSKNSLSINRNYKVKRIKLLFNKGFLFYAEYNIRLFFFLFFSKKDILFSNDVDTLLANYLTSKIQAKKLVFDSHELFSEIPELIHRPHIKRIWLFIENSIIPKLKNNITVSESIAKYYLDKYQSKFTVIKNTPIATELKPSQFPFKTDSKKIILYQGSINIGRGIELMIDTMKHLNNHLFIIIGDGDILNQLKKSVAEKELNDKVIFLGKKTPKELKSLTPLADIGISFEEDMGLNYRFALPNKIFDYIHANVPILISDLPEMKQIINKYHVGEIIKTRKPKEIAGQINQLLSETFSKELQKAKQELNWDSEKSKLINLFDNIQ